MTGVRSLTVADYFYVRLHNSNSNMWRQIDRLNHLSYLLRIIGLAELQERMEVLAWLSDETGSISDPRGNETATDWEEFDRREDDDPHQSAAEEIHTSISHAHLDKPRWMEFLLLKKWHFTLGDVDCVPSVPHGHENAKTQAWPKMNPYTGRVFRSIHQEDISQRLNRTEMRKIWRNKDFIEHCLKQIQWYEDTYPRYSFSAARRGRRLFPRW